MKELSAKIITFIICPFAAYSFERAVYQAIESSMLPKQSLTAFAVGFIVLLILWRIFKRNLRIVCPFEQEVMHPIFGLFLLKRPHAFAVTVAVL